jgi:hypothetical protein
MKRQQPAEPEWVLCARCVTELQPGAGNFFRVTIEAVADPTPVIPPQEEDFDPGQEIKKLLAQMKDVSAQEAMDQIYRRLTIYLCNQCYRRWIEDPTG